MEIKKAVFIKKNKYLEIIYTKNKDINYLDLAAQYLENDFKIIQISPNGSDDKDLLKFSNDLRQLTSLYDSLLIIKDRADIVKISEADGIILDKTSISLSDCRKVLGDAFLFGTSYLDNRKDFDFCISDNTQNSAAIPTFYKIKSKDNVNIYELGKYDFSK